ncbi:hypothetical protein TNCV_4664051 [Trichonephila clavipes]|nr:hypothetical protein TNCV_4664051 [Trichonephila clavipes]
MRMSERWPALEAFFTPEVCIAKFKNLRTYYRNEKQKLSSFRSGTGARDLVPKWEHFARLQFLDDTIQPLDSISNLDNMELEVNADLFENDVELPPIPNRAPSESELPQRIRVFTSTPPEPKNLEPKRKVESSQEAFYETSELDNLPCPKQHVESSALHSLSV